MTDRKTAAELRAMAEAATGYDRMVLLHLAAVEEEREAEDAGDEELAREVTGRASHELRRELDAMTRIADEQRERAKRAERELEAMKRREKVGEWWEVWCETGVVDVYRQRASALRWARGDGDRLVHVTRWRKKR